jgi:transposase
MSTDVPTPNHSSRPLKVTVHPGSRTLVLPSDDPSSATVQIAVVQVPVNQLSDQPHQPAAPLPAPASAQPLSAEQLPDDPATLKRMILELLATLQEEKHEQELLRHRLAQLLNRLYGRRSERVHPDQALLFADIHQPPEPTTAAEKAADDNTSEAPPAKKRRGHGRRRPPQNLPHVAEHHRLSEAERLCPTCGTLREEIGTATTPQHDYQPASFFIRDHIEHKYACPCCSKQGASQIVAARKPEQPLGKGSPGAGLLAYVIVSKYLDHLPLYRQERITERQGLELVRSTTCDWMAECARKLQPLCDLMNKEVLLSRSLHTDDTPVKLLEAAEGETDKGRLWAYLGDAVHPYNVFDFTPNRQRDGPQNFLKTYQGYLHADAFTGYDRLYLPDPEDGQARIHEVACNAHARRKFYEARASDSVGAHRALAYYGQLYEIERRARELSEEVRLQMRRDLAVPILEQFHTWLEEQHRTALPKSPFGEALTYALNQWTALCRYTEAGFLSIDNNWAEREMKRIAVGRKNWLFFGSKQGGKTAAVLYTFTSTCHRLGVEPWAYLKDVLTRLPTTPEEGLAELLPDRWQAARLAARVSSD